MNPGSQEPMGGFAPRAMTEPVPEVIIEDQYNWPLGNGVVVRLTFRHVDRLTVEHLEVLGEYLTTFARVLEKK